MIKIQENNQLSSLKSNYLKVAKILGEDYANQSYRDLLSVKEFQRANETLSQHVYGQGLSKTIKNQNIQRIEEVYNYLTEIYHKNISNSVDMSKLGFILIGPEQYDNRNDYIKYLEELKLSVIYAKDKIIDKNQYFLLNKDALTNPFRQNDLPTNAFNTIGNNSYIIVASGDPKQYQCNSITEFLKRIEGTSGKMEENTFKGDLAYNSLLKYVGGRECLRQYANIPLDPIGAYRMLIREKVNPTSNKFFLDNLDTPIMFYSGESVHVPMEGNLERELSIICDSDEINKIVSNKVITKKKSIDICR